MAAFAGAPPEPPRRAADDPDRTWEAYGAEDPYFGVLADPRFRQDRLTADDRAEFFATGERHVERLMATIRRHVDPDFRPRSVLDYGCGIGRVALPLARIAPRVVGVDISPSMLRAAAAAAGERGIGGVEWVHAPGWSPAGGEFDLVHSYVVLQHLVRGRGAAVVARLLDQVAPGGVAALQFVYARRESLPRRLLYFARCEVPGFERVFARLRGPSAPRLMQMNPIPLEPVLDLLRQRGFDQLHLEFSDHGTPATALPGVFLLARRAGIAGW